MLEPSILFEDSNIIAVSKPAGMLVIPGRGAQEPTLQEWVSHKLGQQPFVVHRLDRDASGLVVFARNPKTHRNLCLAFQNRSAEKDYLALVAGMVTQSGVIERPLRAFGSGRMGIDPRGKPSTTRFTVLKSAPRASLLNVQPETGRRHQIRVHLYALGHPILGDQLYGEARPVGGYPRLMLHALRLKIPGIPATLLCEPTSDFQSLVAQGIQTKMLILPDEV